VNSRSALPQLIIFEDALRDEKNKTKVILRFFYSLNALLSGNYPVVMLVIVVIGSVR